MVADRSYAISDVDAGGRRFSVHVIRFENGAFVAVHEAGSPRIGPMVVSIRSSGTTSTTQVIPDRTGSVLPKLIAEMTSTKTGGIASVTVSAGSALSSEDSRAIMSKVTEML